MLRVNEIFYSLQGEGYFTGTPAIFIRLSGCNLKCTFCDTDHSHYKEMSIFEIIDEIEKFPSKHVVITGGEPSLQLTDDFISELHRHSYFIQVETNGTLKLPENIDWITCSPKTPNIRLKKVNEIKVLFNGVEPIYSPDINAEIFSLQPLDCGNKNMNNSILHATIRYILANPKWRLSLQTHKLLD
ncbi:MAG: 7-carboxy-7-deazaguanine synthase QueE, partial [Paramuribaculum sp.]|nr:7-carboxy-7-deazaguanine synthase QueE [Paramuribaculum sp.]